MLFTITWRFNIITPPGLLNPVKQHVHLQGRVPARLPNVLHFTKLATLKCIGPPGTSQRFFTAWVTNPRRERDHQQAPAWHKELGPHKHVWFPFSQPCCGFPESNGSSGGSGTRQVTGGLQTGAGRSLRRAGGKAAGAQALTTGTAPNPARGRVTSGHGTGGTVSRAGMGAGSAPGSRGSHETSGPLAPAPSPAAAPRVGSRDTAESPRSEGRSPAPARPGPPWGGPGVAPEKLHQGQPQRATVGAAPGPP